MILDCSPVIINADDFGYNRQVTDTIISVHQRGLVTSTTIMVNMPGFEHACQAARQCPNLSVGIHLNIAEGVPVLPANQIPSLVRQGQFVGGMGLRRQIRLGKVRLGQLRAEFEAQIQRCLKYGISPTHLDSHKHLHTNPLVYLAVRQAAKKYGLTKIRLSRNLYPTDGLGGCSLTPQPFGPRATLKRLGKSLFNTILRTEFSSTDWFGAFDAERLDNRCTHGRALWQTFLQHLPQGTVEIGCHIGYDTMDEKRVFSDEEFVRDLQRSNAYLISWRELG